MTSAASAGDSSCSVFRGIAALVMFLKAVLKSALSAGAGTLSVDDLSPLIWSLGGKV